MATLGTYHVQIQASAAGISNQIKQALGSPLDSEAKSAGSRMGGFMSSGIGKALAVVGGGAAITGVFKSGISAAREFESGMNEVFTLLPGISDSAMSDMEGQVKDFSKQFGVLPSETIPALYQSLSAGVPPDNVFDFMETAQQAAKGGVTELSTAVDGISSVVNAFGSDVISATEASDLMFTAVRLGKTTYGELAASMSNVAPVASALGIGFEDVTAGLAVLTSQGVPTAQATTQMRAAFAELGKSGSVADKAFQDIVGKSFPDFIAEGGNVQEAFQLMSDGATANGSSLIDMFGSIEAGQAVMALTKNGGEAFATALDEMQNSAGATETAFNQMNQGIGPAFDRLKVSFNVAMIGIGEKLAPLVVTIAEKLPGAMTSASKAASKFGAKVAPLGPILKSVGEAVVTAFNWLADHKEVVIGVLAGVAAGLVAWGISAAATAIANFTLASSFIALAAPFIAIGAAVAAAVAALVWAYNNVTWFRNAVDATVSWLQNTAWPVVKKVFSAIGDFIAKTVSAAKDAIDSATSTIEKLWAKWGDRIMGVAQKAWSYIQTQTENVMNIIRGVIKLVTSVIEGDWSGAWEAIKQIATSAGEYLKTFLSATWSFIQNAAWAAFSWLALKLGGLMGEARDFVLRAATDMANGLWDRFNSAKDWVIDKVFAMVGRVIELFFELRSRSSELMQSIWDRLTSAGTDIANTLRYWFNVAKDWAIEKALNLVSWMEGLPSKLVNAVGDVGSLLKSKGTDLIEGLRNGLVEKWSLTVGWVKDLGNKAKNGVGDLGGKLVGAGKDFVQGLIDGMASKLSAVISKAQSIASAAINAVTGVFRNGSPSKVMMEIGRFAGEGLVIGMDSMQSKVEKSAAAMVKIPEAAGLGVSLGDTPATVAAGQAGGSAPFIGSVTVLDGHDWNREVDRTMRIAALVGG